MIRPAGITLSVIVVAIASMGALSARPGDVDALQPYTNAWLMTFHGDDGTVSAPQLWEDSMETVTWRGRSAMHRVQIEHRLIPVGGYQRTENVFDARTLEPYMTEQRQRNGAFIRWEYDGLHLQEIRSVRPSAAGAPAPDGQGESVTRAYAVEKSFVDFYGGMYATVLAARSLTVGLDGTFAALIAPDTVVDVPFTVVGRETVRGVGGQPTAAFKVEMGIRSGPGASGGTFTAWMIDRPPYVLRLTTRQVNPSGYWSWDEK